MTAQPTQDLFTKTLDPTPRVAGLRRPNVDEHYWGYAISAQEQSFNLAVVLRALAGTVGLACLIGAVGVWFLPQSYFSGDPAVVKALGAILMTCVAAMLLRYVGRGTSLKIQIDRTTGEVREVVDGVFGSDVVLAHHGMDVIEKIEIMPSSFDPSFGQIQIKVKGKGRIPAGAGDRVVLRGLRDRIASDVGLERTGTVHEAVWVNATAS